jgi:C1A family cysteine protease
MYYKDTLRLCLSVFFTFIVIGFFSSSNFLLSETDSQKVTNKTAAEIYPYDAFPLSFTSSFLRNRRTAIVPGTYYGTRTVLTQDDIDNLPPGFSWLDAGIMTPVKDQLTCGSCWAHACLGLFEALIKRSDGVDVDLSEQQLVNCYADGHGCWGASNIDAMLYMVSSGIVLESVYPYLNDHWPCDLNADPDYYLEAARFLPMRDPRESKSQRRHKIKHLIKTYGPVVAFMLCYTDFWFDYRAGIYSYDGVSELRTGHSVDLVGWMDDSTIPTGGYWIAKNSFGPQWGENGYFRIAYDSEEFDIIELDIVVYSIYNGADNDPPYFAPRDYGFIGSEGSELSFTIGAADPDNDRLTYSAPNMPAGMHLNPDTGAFTWTPDYTQSGDYTLYVTITDGEYTVRTGVPITISNRKKIKY